MGRSMIGSIVLDDRDLPVCDMDGDTVIATALTTGTGSRLFRCTVCNAREWIGV